MDKKIQGRSCNGCKYRYKQESLMGSIDMCDIWEKEISVKDYCNSFKEKK